MLRNSGLLALALAGAALPASAQTAARAPEWLAGCWRGEAGSAADGAFEIWTRPQAGQMLGISQTVRGTRKFFEYMRIEERDGRLLFIPQPNGKPPVEFPAQVPAEVPAATAEATRAVFANPAHDFPKYVDYARSGEHLIAQLSSAPPNTEGKRQRFAFRIRYHELHITDGVQHLILPYIEVR